MENLKILPVDIHVFYWHIRGQINANVCPLLRAVRYWEVV